MERGLLGGRIVRSIFLGVLLSSCPSLSTMHTALPIGVGETEISGSVGAFGFSHEDGALPILDGQIRRGYGERWDAGLRVSNLSMLHADLNYALVVKEDFVLSIDPTLSVLPTGDNLATFICLPILADIVRTENLTLTLSARYGYFALDRFEPGDDNFGLDESTPLVGFGVGARFRAMGITWMPELHMLQEADSSIDADPLIAFSIGFVL
jgi:hypothetical protein